MGPGGNGARWLGALLWRGALPWRAKSAARFGPRPPLLALGRPAAGPALCLAPGPARCLHVGSRTEERADAAAGEGYPESGAAGNTSPKFDIDMLVSLLRQENAKDICVIKIPPEMNYTDYFVIGSGTSTRHLHAMAYYIVKMYKYLKCKNEPHVKIEGKDTDDWLCVDFDAVGKPDLLLSSQNRGQCLCSSLSHLPEKKIFLRERKPTNNIEEKAAW
ncbi:mitochondrial assembly of ribosomal large subunit protein 1 isoform X2 [Dasypus novemcinctus]|uniref:mitochondrial assembly of ribosomal large subunit protein 1 isoform X2 n=1 Tax=Dasypus novemcinctus TaxID=9361 RepID=UPI000C8203A2